MTDINLGIFTARLDRRVRSMPRARSCPSLPQLRERGRFKDFKMRGLLRARLPASVGSRMPHPKPAPDFHPRRATGRSRWKRLFGAECIPHGQDVVVATWRRDVRVADL